MSWRDCMFLDVGTPCEGMDFRALACRHGTEVEPGDDSWGPWRNLFHASCSSTITPTRELSVVVLGSALRHSPRTWRSLGQLRGRADIVCQHAVIGRPRMPFGQNLQQASISQECSGLSGPSREPALYGVKHRLCPKSHTWRESTGAQPCDAESRERDTGQTRHSSRAHTRSDQRSTPQCLREVPRRD
jgi:hypothetical protein